MSTRKTTPDRSPQPSSGPGLDGLFDLLVAQRWPIAPDPHPDEEVRLSDIVWGGRVRVAWQDRVRAIASAAAVRTERSVHGSPLSSRSTMLHVFLDGGVEESRGFFDASCGMFIRGDLARVYILHGLGLDPDRVLETLGTPPLAQLEAVLAAQKR